MQDLHRTIHEEFLIWLVHVVTSMGNAGHTSRSVLERDRNPSVKPAQMYINVGYNNSNINSALSSMAYMHYVP